MHPYPWLLRHGDEEHSSPTDAVLLVDAWLTSRQVGKERSRQRTPLVEETAMGWADELLITSLRDGRPRPVSPKARARVIKRMAEWGLTADQIKKALHRR